MAILSGNEIIPNAIVGQDGTGAPAAITQSHRVGSVAGAGSSFASAQLDSTGTTLANVSGLSQVLTSGTWRFHAGLPGTAGATGGVKYAFTYTGMTLTSIEATGKAFTASAVAVQHTTTTASQTALLSSTSAAIYSEIDGTLTVSGTGLAATGATIQLQFAQSAATTVTSSVYANANMQFVKIGA